jgi:hypothetical protein
VHLEKISLFGRLFVAGAEFEADGGADEAEGGADLVGEEAIEGEVETDVAVLVFSLDCCAIEGERSL